MLQITLMKIMSKKSVIAYKKAKETSLTLYRNVDRTLHELTKMALKIAVISDAPSREAWIRICSVNLEHTFDTVVTLHDQGIHKPSSEPFLKAIESLQVNAEETLMVGDWPERDIKGAKQFGMKTAFGFLFPISTNDDDLHLLIKTIVAASRTEFVAISSFIDSRED